MLKNDIMDVIMMNSINVIHPYFENGYWVFDDPAKDLEKEPFISGIPEIIESILPANYRGKFSIVFSKNAFPGYNFKLSRLYEEADGYWYRLGEQSGWLCPAMFKYFDKAPEEIYFKVEGIQ
jgi:hypothetical protein